MIQTAIVLITLLFSLSAQVTSIPSASGGGGSSFTSTSGAYSSLPGTCSTGSIYQITDAPYMANCLSTNTWQLYWLGMGVPVSSSSAKTWTWVNQGSSSVTTYGPFMSVQGAAGTSGLSARLTTLPSTPYTLIYCGGTGGDMSGPPAWGAGHFETATNKGLTLSVENGAIWLRRWTSTGSNVGVSAITLPHTITQVCFKFVNNGTTITSSYSNNRYAWTQIGSADTITSSFTTAPDRASVYVSGNGGSYYSHNNVFDFTFQ